MNLEILVISATSRETEFIKRRILDCLQGKNCVPLIRMDQIRISEPIPEKIDRAFKYPVGITFRLADVDKLAGLKPDWVVTTDEECAHYFRMRGSHILKNIEDLYDILQKMPENDLNRV